MAVRGVEAAAMLPERRPEAFAVGLRYGETVKRGTGKELKAALGMRRRNGRDPQLHLEKEHEPMRVALVAMFADEAGEVEIAGREDKAHFLVCLAAGASVGRLADVSLELAAGRTPQAAIRLLRALEQEDFIRCVEAVEERGDFVGQRQSDWNQLHRQCEGLADLLLGPVQNARST